MQMLTTLRFDTAHHHVQTFVDLSVMQLDNLEEAVPLLPLNSNSGPPDTVPGAAAADSL